ncbi:MAG: hypothetical protein ABL959_07805 [Pyrinomonadaceae bacterium]
MKRVLEKVKDIVEVRPFTHLHDFGADPALTLGGYHFTDITADLMGKWIDRISRVKPGHGAALALAGFRGVGKSHFLAVVGAIVARPELRSNISDTYVSTCTDRLARRHGSVVSVKRGVGTSLVDELKRAVAELLNVNPGTLSDSLYDLLLRASEHAGDAPLVVLIDTALGRETRVSRDDGLLISEIAEAGETLGIFVGVALDDDISGADGPNSSISSSFTIDYLDQEHLYKIVDTHVFTKSSQQLPLLREIYEYYRQVMPGFRWSEQRFVSLYPLHPATVEISPLIRLFVHDFALLGFAAEAGVKILGRPANSLIGLDEVYDKVEARLRNVAELAETFASFEAIEQQVVAKMPVQQRLHAKLILKGLLMLSLDGQGTTAIDIAASMMIFDEQQSATPAIDVSAILDSFAVALPNAISRIEGSSGPKYCLQVSSKSAVTDVLANAIGSVTDADIRSCLTRLAAEKFSDVELGDEVSICSVEWRGSIRRGRLEWSPKSRVGSDWSIRVQYSDDQAAGEGSDIVWRVGELGTDEKDTLRRYHLLQNDQAVRDALATGLSTALHQHSIAAEKIWQRVFLSNSRIIADDTEHSLAEDVAAASHSLSQLFSPVLSEIFAHRYPNHPDFFRSLGEKETAKLIAEFFSPSGTNSGDVQNLAVTFAEPLGLSSEEGGALVPLSAEALNELPLVRAAFDGATSNNGVFSLADIAERLSAQPVGLTREAQHVVLAALVAQREYEFVTSSGNRINHRSLDLQIIWDDIVGLAKPKNDEFPAERFLAWAKLTTGNAGIRSVDRAEDRLLIIDSLAGWLNAWNQSRVLADFEALPEESLNARIWRTAASLKKSFGAMAAAIDSLVKDELTLDKCIQAIAEHFSDSETDFEKKKSELRILGDFTNSVSRRTAVASYLAVCEGTDDPDIEDARKSILEAIDPGRFWANASDLKHVEDLWQKFLGLYGDYYSERHDAVMLRSSASEGLREVLASSEWSAFECLYRIPWADQRYIARSRGLIREMRQLKCDAKLVDILAERPYCSCSYTLSDHARLSDLPEQLRSTISLGLSALESRFVSNKPALLDGCDSEAMRASVKRILDEIEGGLDKLSGQDLRLIRTAAERAVEGAVGSFNVEAGDDPEVFELFSDGLPMLGSAPFELSVNR